jgi:SAM-dependent methyltransferase
MSKELTEKEIEEIAKQLGCPAGEMGLDIAETMEVSNFPMTEKGIQALALKGGEYVLEVGHGNAAHLKYLLKPSVRYYGLDISPLMKSEAERINALYLKSDQASFHVYDGLNIPFEDNTFDKALTVNTLYFWKEPVKFLDQVHRVMKPGGQFNVVFGQKLFMEQLPFTKYGFNLYTQKEVEDMMAKSAFSVVDFNNYSDVVSFNNLGDEVMRHFSVITVEK